MAYDVAKETARIISACSECGLCARGCDFLAESGSPAQMVLRGLTKEDAYGCSLCGRCKAVCPLSLSPLNMFQARRSEAIHRQELDPDEFNYFMPDNEHNVMNSYRRFYQIDYQNLEGDAESEFAFFPGCTLMTYSPALTREIYRRIRQKHGCQGVLTDCCGLPLSQMGLQARAQAYTASFIQRLSGKGIKTLITACPNCYYRLQEILSPIGVKILTIYEAIDLAQEDQQEEKQGQEMQRQEMQRDLPVCTVHDSCPDRFQGIFARQARTALRKMGYPISEMGQILEDSPCCGSGGQVTHFRPDLADKLVKDRLAEAKKSGAQILVSYCLSCVLNFARIESDLKVRHVMNLLLGIDEDYSEIKKQAAAVFAEST